MKSQFYFPYEPITGYANNDNKNQILVNKGIKNKVHKKIIELPYIPTKEMKVDLSTYSEFYGFTKNELQWINDCNQIFNITNIIIEIDRIKIWLEY